MDTFGKGAYTIPIWTDIIQNAYLKGWQGVINGDGAGTHNLFTGLNAYNPNPVVAGTIRQGFAGTTLSLSPYIATSAHDLYVLRSIYDSPLVENPANNEQLLDWMTTSHSILTNAQLGGSYAACGAIIVQPCYPTTTCNSGNGCNIRLDLRNDIFFQDGNLLTGWDIKFAWASLLAKGAFLGNSLAPVHCGVAGCLDGITVKSRSEVDIHLDSMGPFTRLGVGTSLVFPGHYWSSNCAGKLWEGNVTDGTIETKNCLTLDSNKSGFSFDPIANHVMVGSGPWECADLLGGTSQIGFGCSSTGTQNPPVDQDYILTRYGKGQAPGARAVGTYFRSFGNLALYLWAGAIDGTTTQDTVTGSAVSGCNTPSQPTPTLGITQGCGHWQQGIGQASGLGPVTIIQVSIFQRFDLVNWVQPYTWAAPPCNLPASGPINCTGATAPPDFMAQLTGSTFFEGPNTLQSASSIRIGGTTLVGCTTAYNPTSPSTSGGFDC
jgi:hypothetical protein